MRHYSDQTQRTIKGQWRSNNNPVLIDWIDEMTICFQDGVSLCNTDQSWIHCMYQPGLNSQRSTCFYLLNAGIKAVGHHNWLNVILNSNKLDSCLLRSGTRQRCPPAPPLPTTAFQQTGNKRQEKYAVWEKDQNYLCLHMIWLHMLNKKKIKPPGTNNWLQIIQCV